MADSDAIEAGGRSIVTWLTPYIETWEANVGAIAYGRLAKAITPARKLLGDERCQAAFLAYCQSFESRKDPAFFAKECLKWSDIADTTEPVVSIFGALTAYGKRLYAGR